jgi:Aminoglycoside-2''-adenylyltransferase
MVAPVPSKSEGEQLAALSRIHQLLVGQEIEYWLFGGWAVDFHAGSVTRAHDDLDIAVWHEDLTNVVALLAADGWKHVPAESEDGYTSYELGPVRLEVAFLVRPEDGDVYTPLVDGRAGWPDAAFGDDVAELLGVRARVMSLGALRADKAEIRDDSSVTAKDRTDLRTLAGL